MRDDKRNYVVVGVFVLAMVAALIAWILMVSGRTGATDDYSVVFDNVSGLKPGVEILYEGYPVGLIGGIEPIDRDGRRRFRIDVTVRRGWPIPEDSEAAVTSGLFSAAVIDISGGDSDRLLPPGSEIPALAAQDIMAVVNSAAQRLGKLLDSVSDKVPNIMTDVERLASELNTAVDSVNVMLAPENAQRVTSILTNVDGLTADANEALTGLGDTRRRIDALIAKLDGMLDEESGDVAEAMAELKHSLAAVSRHIDAIAANLEVTTRNMGEFSQQIRDDPSLLIRGREAPDGK
jgi:phospholipid/cholesterol/gamma-HCH transport system substrate-binding protein